MHKFKQDKVVGMTRAWTKSGVCSAEMRLGPGKYVVIPCLYEACKDAEIPFYLEIVTEKQCKW